MQINEQTEWPAAAQIDDFRELLLKHARHPSHAGDPSSFTHRGTCKNPLCGDAVDVGVSVLDGRISQIQIQSSGCGISIASASLMTEMVEGQTINDTLSNLDLFNEALLASREAAWPERISALRPLSRLRESPTRVPCALIGWFALKDALKRLL